LSRKLNCYLDRFEGDTAVILVAGTQVEIPRGLLPDRAAEGDYLLMEITIDAEARAKAEQDISRLKHELGTDTEEEQGA
jgi:DNA mismatch repair protein MutH